MDLLEARLRRKLNTVNNEQDMAKVRQWFLEQMTSPAYKGLYFGDLSPFVQWFAEYQVFAPYQRAVEAQNKK